MRIGIIGTGAVAGALARVWVAAGNEVYVGGRSDERAAAVAAAAGATPAPLPDAVRGRDAVLLAVSWTGVDDAVRLAGAGDGALRDVPLLDPTNAVEHGIGVLLPPTSAAEHVAARTGARVVKAFHLFPAAAWGTEAAAGITVPLCGDDPEALEIAGSLVRATGARPAVIGGLARARQLEEVAGFVIGLAFAGVDPNSAIPRVPA